MTMMQIYFYLICVFSLHFHKLVVLLNFKISHYVIASILRNVVNSSFEGILKLFDSYSIGFLLYLTLCLLSKEY